MAWWVLWLVACGGGEVAAPQAEAPAAPEVAAPEGAAEPEGRVYFVAPKDGETVKSPVKIVMGIEGMEVRPAGDQTAATGHHHVIIGPAGIEKGTQVPADERHIHFGKGQTEADVELPPGDHQITLQFADGNHISFGEGLATTITITVEE